MSRRAESRTDIYCFRNRNNSTLILSRFVAFFILLRTWCSLKHKEADLKKFSKEAAKDEEEDLMKRRERMEVSSSKADCN